MKTQRYCKHCNVSFLAENREINRGNAHYCSLSCVALAKAQKEDRPLFDLVCKHCSKSFKAYVITARHCSVLCKQKTYRLNKKSGNVLDRQLEEIIKEYPCEVCSWIEAPRDSHHIIHVSKGGKSTLDNLISLCPNCHRKAHYNLFSQDYLLKIVKSRTISSSLESLLVKIKSKEQDANLVIKEINTPPVVSEPS